MSKSKYSHRYSVTKCPDCSADLTLPGGVDMLWGAFLGRFDHAKTRLTSDGELVDVNGIIASGLHKGTLCTRCDAQLDTWEISPQNVECELRPLSVPLRFEGAATVMVPKHLGDKDAKLLAENLALAQVLATVDNPDCGEALGCACDDYKNHRSDESTDAEADFDAAKAEGVTGRWTIPNGTDD